jgi:regulator of RNase E activity RraA
MEWAKDSELFALMRTTLYTAVVGDILDGLGRHHQFLPQPVQPLRDDMIVAGRAMPVLLEDIAGPQDPPFGQLTAALDQLEPGEVYIASESLNAASWGELMTAAARTRGSVGAVLNGFHRDTPKVLEQNWPVFSRGRYAQDASVRSAVVDFRCPLYIGEVRIDPGDLVFGDVDGVLIIPQDVEVQVIEKALEKARGEKAVRAEIEAGASTTSVLKKYGIL